MKEGRAEKSGLFLLLKAEFMLQQQTEPDPFAPRKNRALTRPPERRRRSRVKVCSVICHFGAEAADEVRRTGVFASYFLKNNFFAVRPEVLQQKKSKDPPITPDTRGIHLTKFITPFSPNFVISLKPTKRFIAVKVFPLIEAITW